AATRAAFLLACSGYWWSDGVSRLGPSEFLTEVRAACGDGAGVVEHWHPEPEPDAVNPALAEPPTATWPAAAAAGARYEAVRDAGALVEAAARALRDGAAVPSVGGSDPDGGQAEDRDQDQGRDRYQEMVAAWTRDTDLLLAERERRQHGQEVLVALPR